MLKYGIKSTEVRQALETGERIENYADDTPLPSYLVLGKAGRVLHALRMTRRPRRPS